MRGTTVLLMMTTIIVSAIILETHVVVGGKPSIVLRRRQKVRHYIVRCCNSNKARSTCRNPPTRTSTTKTTAHAAPTKPPVKTTVRSPSSSAHRQTVVSTPRPPTAGRVKSSREPLPTEVPAQEPGTSVLEEITNQEQPQNQLPTDATASDSASTDVTAKTSTISTGRIPLTSGQSQPPGSTQTAAQTGGVSLQTLPQAASVQPTAGSILTNLPASGGSNPGSNPAISTVKGAAASQSTAGVTTMSGGVTVSMVSTTSQSQGTVMGATNGPASTVVGQQTTVKVQTTSGVAMSSDAGPTVLGLQSTASTLSEVQTTGVISTADVTASTSLITNGGIPPTGGQTFSQPTGAGSTAPAAQTVAGSPQTVLQGSSDPGLQSTGGATTDPATDTGASSATNPASIAQQESSPVVTVDNTPTSAVSPLVTTVADLITSQPGETTIINDPTITITGQQTTIQDPAALTDPGGTTSSENTSILDLQSTVTSSDPHTNTNGGTAPDSTQTTSGSVTQVSGSESPTQGGTQAPTESTQSSAPTQAPGETTTETQSSSETTTVQSGVSQTTQAQTTVETTTQTQGVVLETTQSTAAGATTQTTQISTGVTTQEATTTAPVTTTVTVPTTSQCGICTGCIAGDVQGRLDAIKNIPGNTQAPSTLSLITLNGTKYYFDKDKALSWFGALTFCRSYGMELLSIDSQDEQDAIADMLKTNGRDVNWVFTGGNKINRTCPYQWESTGQNTTAYENWYPGEPSQWTGENCLIIWTSGKWYDLPCGLGTYFVCELPPGGVSTTTTTTPAPSTTTTPAPTTTTTTPCPLCPGCAGDIQSRADAIKNIPAQTQAPTALSLITLNGTKYFFDKDKALSWFGALTFCRSYGMEMLSIDSQDEQNAIADMLKTNSRDVNWVFAGGSKIGRTCPYQWESTGQNTTAYENWYPGEPSQGTGENCLILWTSGKWYDLPCGIGTYFVCELPPGGVSTTTTTTPAPTTTTTTPCPLCPGCAGDIQSRTDAIKNIPAQTQAPTALSLITLNGTKYFFDKDKALSWFGALTFCRSYGMEMLSIDSQDEQNAIADMLKTNGRDVNWVFAGGSKIGRTCPYQWESTGQNTTPYENWYPGEPSQGTGENCLILWTSGKWYDLPCGIGTYFVCELPPGGVSTTTTTTPAPTTTTTTPCGLCPGCAGEIQSRIDAINSIPAQTQAPTSLALITLNGTKYFFDKDKALTWFGALTFCRTYGMDLLSIDTEDEQNAIAAMLKSNGRDANFVFTGGSKIGRTCPYQWESTRQNVTFENWSPGEPANWPSENCMIIWLNGKWFDLPCAWGTYFVCELN